MPVTPEIKAEITPRIGGMTTRVNGVGISVAPGKTGAATWTMEEDLHVQGVKVYFKNCDLGDSACLALIHPSGSGVPAAAINSGQTDVDMGASLAPYYDPASGAIELQVWNAAEDELKEIRKIVSKAGNVITCEGNFSATYDTTHIIKAVYHAYSSPVGADGLGGGAKLLGDNIYDLYNQIGVTEKVSTGLHLCLIVMAVAGGIAREIAANFSFRVPVPE